MALNESGVNNLDKEALQPPNSCATATQELGLTKRDLYKVLSTKMLNTLHQSAFDVIKTAPSALSITAKEEDVFQMLLQYSWAMFVKAAENLKHEALPDSYDESSTRCHHDWS